MSDYIKNGGYSGHAWQGEKCDTSKDIADIAKEIRSEIKRAIAANELPKGKYSVTIERYAGGQSLNVKIREFEFPILNAEHVRYMKANPHCGRPPVGDAFEPYSKVARLTVEKLTAMVNAYRYDDSEGMIDYFDTNFYKSIGFDWRLENAERERILAEMGAA